MKDKMIKQYIRNKKGVPVGVLVAVLEDSVVTFGWSLCHKSDQFVKAKGTMIAENRARADKTIGLPETLIKPLEDFIDRAGRYYAPKPYQGSEPVELV